MGNNDKYATVIAGERIDNLAQRVLGDAGKYMDLLRANPTLDLWHPQPGLLIRIPDAR